mgnify:CR=1 FL=1
MSRAQRCFMAPSPSCGAELSYNCGPGAPLGDADPSRRRCRSALIVRCSPFPKKLLIQRIRYKPLIHIYRLPGGAPGLGAYMKKDSRVRASSLRKWALSYDRMAFLDICQRGRVLRSTKPGIVGSIVAW